MDNMCLPNQTLGIVFHTVGEIQLSTRIDPQSAESDSMENNIKCWIRQTHVVLAWLGLACFTNNLGWSAPNV